MIEPIHNLSSAESKEIKIAVGSVKYFSQNGLQGLA